MARIMCISRRPGHGAPGGRPARPAGAFAVDAAALARAGVPFYCSANGVWLVDHVPPTYLRLLDGTREQ